MCERTTVRIIDAMTPDDLLIVQRSWYQLRDQRTQLVVALMRGFGDVGASSIAPATHAWWLYAAVDELVGLLSAPSRLAAQARALGATWPDPLTAPSFAVEGRVWLEAAATCLPAWSDRMAAAWKEAWFLLSDVLATEALSPFVDDPHPTRSGRSGEPPALPGRMDPP